MRGIVLTAVAVSLGFAVWMVLQPAVTEALAAIAGLFVSLASLLLTLVDFFRATPGPAEPAALADDLALRLREQWLDEAQARRLRDPRVLPLAWTTTGRGLADELRTARGRVLRARLDGRLEGRLDDVTARLAEGWAQVPNQRLVAIGEPGSGKTVLAMLLTLGVLEARDPGGPVPVLLPVSSWDPVRERLDDWIVRTLAQPYYNGRAEIPRTLLTRGLLLPVLDGLDEIPESARRSAIRGINDAIGGERPIVVTCRAVEYEELIRGGAPTLRRAAVVEIVPVPPDEVIDYLRDVGWPPGVDWQPVFDRLRTDPGSPVAAALSTPLMVTSARLVYERGGGSPGELLDADRFDSRYAVEDHLTHGLVDAAYAPDPTLPEGERPPDRWTAQQARRWLTFLACYLHDRRERDLAWWLISGRLLSPWAGPVTGIGIGAVLVLAAVLWMTVTQSIASENRGTAIVTALCVGGAFALFNSLVWYASEARLPGRLTWSVRGSAGRLRRGFRIGAVLALAALSPPVLGFTAQRVIEEPGGRGTPRAVELYVEAVTVSLALALVVGVALAAHNWLDAPPSRAIQVSPLKSLALDRRSALVSAGVAGLLVALTGLLGWYVGVVAGDLLLRVLTDWTGWPGRHDAGMLAADRWHQLMAAFGNRSSVVGVAALLPGAFFTLLVLMGRAWPRFVVARFYLAARGKLPWRLMTFLADARRRELLRQSGSAYQFRHIRLQETLAGEPTYTDDDRARDAARRAAVRRRVVLAAGAAVAVAGAGVALSRRRDGSVAVYADPQRRPATSLAFRPGAGRELAFALADGSVWLWGGYTDSGRPVRVRKAFRNQLEVMGTTDLVFHPSGRFLVMSAPKVGAEVRRAEADGARTSVLDHPEEVFGDTSMSTLVRDASGNVAAGVDTDLPGLWRPSASGRYENARSQDPSWWWDVVEDPIWAVDFLRDGSLVILDRKGKTWRWPDGGSAGSKKPRPFRPKTEVWNASRALLDIEEHTGGLACGRHDDTLALFGPKGGELWAEGSQGWQVTRPLGQVTNGVFHPSRPLLAVAARYGGDIHIWHTDNPLAPRPGKTLTGHNDTVVTLDFSPDGHWLATAAADGTLRIWAVSDFAEPQ